MESVLGELIHTKTNSVDFVFLASRGKSQPWKQRHGNIEDIQCRHCNELGHKSGHVILDCRLLKNKQSQSAFVTMSCDEETKKTNATSLTPQAIQKMIQDSMQSTLPGAISSVFSVAGLSGKGIKSTPWFLDSAAFNHMTNQKHAFVDLKPCSLHQSLTDHNCLVQFSSHGCDVQDLQTGQVTMKGHKHGS
ncbi:hypothetical protein ACOSQ4_032326 [Xanthoceras sorbifolium]